MGKRYLLNVWSAFDQLTNALLLGDPQETLSSRMGKRARSGQAFPLCFCRFLSFFNPNHCEKAINDREGAGSGANNDNLLPGDKP